MTESPPPSQPPAKPSPDMPLPGGRVGQLLTMGVLAGLVAVDDWGLHGLLFRSHWWDVALKGITVTGLVLGAAAYLRSAQ